MQFARARELTREVTMPMKTFKRCFSMFAVGALLAVVGCAAQPADPSESRSTAQELTAPSGSHTAHFERLNAEDAIENLRAVTPEEKSTVHTESLTCPGNLVQCGRCEDYIFCTTWLICEKICGSGG
jgi:hypothetical protein